jgi:polyisoprenoid-binding protein YceI
MANLQRQGHELPVIFPLRWRNEGGHRMDSGLRKAMRAAIAICAAAMWGDVPGDEFRLVSDAGPALNLYVEKTGFLSGRKHHFTFERFDGIVRMKAGKPQVVLTVESGSIVCRDTWVSEKDRVKIVRTALEDLLAAAEHPLVRFESTEVIRSGDDQFRVSGALTIRATTKPLTVVMRQSGSVYSGEARFRMTDYKLKPPSAALGLVGTKDEMVLTFRLRAVAR